MDVEAAVAATSWAVYALLPDGAQLPQTSSPRVIVSMLRLLDVAPGMRVWEIGTGSGYSTALLSRLVGPAGHVHSVEVDAELVPRARALLDDDGVTNVEVVHADGVCHHPEGAVFDRLISWASCDNAAPTGWLRQVRVGGVVVVPLRNESHVIKFRIWNLDAPPHREATLAATFIPLTPQPFRPWEADSR